jgi:hypothetical protein
MSKPLNNINYKLVEIELEDEEGAESEEGAKSKEVKGTRNKYINNKREEIA